MYNGYQASAKVSATTQNFDSIKTFIAGEVTECSAGLVPTLADPKAGTATITYPSGLTGSNAETYFKNYALATIKNPYNTSSTTNGMVGSSGSCTGANSNDYVAHAQSRSDLTIMYSINQLNVKMGF